MEKQGLIIPIKKRGGQKQFSKKSVAKYLKEHHSPKTVPNISKRKKRDLIIKEKEATYTTENKRTKISKIDELYFHKDSIWIYNADILKTESIKENSIDLIVTSPPYNVDIKYNSHNDIMSYDDYLSFTREWLTRCYTFIKEDGRFCLNIPLDKNKGGQQSVCADIATIAKQVEWKHH
ncbi:MAG: hypothetical protein HZB54_01715 [Deltaproteobacteria bacterium]|nr:hypothetical protein [Deltaproteobacteria bacterium]